MANSPRSRVTRTRVILSGARAASAVEGPIARDPELPDFSKINAREACMLPASVLHAFPMNAFFAKPKRRTPRRPAKTSR